MPGFDWDAFERAFHNRPRQGKVIVLASLAGIQGSAATMAIIDDVEIPLYERDFSEIELRALGGLFSEPLRSEELRPIMPVELLEKHIPPKTPKWARGNQHPRSPRRRK